MLNLRIAQRPPVAAILLSALCALSACSGGVPASDPAAGSRSATATPARTAGTADWAADDVVVIAVIDSGLNPYHFDFLAEHMPQHQNEDQSDDLPLYEDPAQWLPGHPGGEAFKSYTALNLSLTPDDPEQSTAVLGAIDKPQWDQVTISEGSDNADVHMYWIPGTKVIGHVAFAGGLIGDPATSAVLGSSSGRENTFAEASHGVGSSSVSAGNIYGSCPSCLLVYVHGTSEQANEWVAQQDWIDLQTNSWGYSLTVRDRLYAGSDTELQKTATERGQSIFFSAGNGQANTFTVPNPTLFSSQEGPDWILTVGAVSPGDRSSYSGHGKPADIASLGSSYPAGRGGNGSTTAQGTFSGTSNATPVTAGMYGQALYELRRLLPGPSRMQHDGIVATGDIGCAAANADCATADGVLTVHEMREALLRAAQRTAAGTSVQGLTLPATENIAELEFASEGQGSLFGKMDGADAWREEIQRIVGFATGQWFEARSAEERDWLIADSVCRQSVWGSWDHGYSNLGATPANDPNWPLRSFLAHECGTVIGPVVEAERAYQDLFN